MVVMGKAEREKFESDRDGYAPEVRADYDCTRIYHDGQRIMFESTDGIPFEDFMRLLAIKRRPNRKPTCWLLNTSSVIAKRIMSVGSARGTLAALPT